VKCQREHRKQHKKECKKRAAELRDEHLFKQPESTNLGDCPICFLPLPLDTTKSSFMECCGKLICNGCEYANSIREFEGRSLEDNCPFCRHPAPESEEEIYVTAMKRIEANDPVALCQMGGKLFHEGDYKTAFEYLSKAAGLGDFQAHFNLAVMYGVGQGVEEDEKKMIYHLEEAAIGGHPDARQKLGFIEGDRGEYTRGLKHFIIAAKLGHDRSWEVVKESYAEGLVGKEDFASTLSAHQAAVDAMKSPQREAAEVS
jgi:tetratricopeptide (TPR) repeat protein